MEFRKRYSSSLWEEMDKLQREMNRMFDSAYTNRSGTVFDFPAINVWTKPESGQVIIAELPGINPDELDIKVIGESITISGSRNSPEESEDLKYHRQERGYGRFTRSIQLPFPVESERVEANYEKGILKIWLPRAEADKPRKIVVKSNS
ncbi:MAG: Hsp20/alpha crystallin family protein [Chloroflexi bacterium HGW-Chloroflexi-8]|jgi:HSP20 family protein|nr:MAG: Hsp20/alpha crystallin family protein [Chloroflexi bacterium HGW-Chloroflexi-8]